MFTQNTYMYVKHGKIYLATDIVEKTQRSKHQGARAKSLPVSGIYK